MKINSLCLYCGAGLLLACTANRLKQTDSYSENTVHLVYGDSTINQNHVERSVWTDRQLYDTWWWLKGNVHLNPDSGFAADEALIHVKHARIAEQRQVDSAQYRLRQTAARQQLTHEQAEETQKIKKNMGDLPWWCYVLIISVPVFMGYRYLKKR